MWPLSREEELKFALCAEWGLEESWDVLEAHFFKAIQGYFCGRNGGDEDLAEKLTEYCMKRAKKNIQKGKYNPGYSFYTFLRNIAKFIWYYYLVEGIGYITKEIYSLDIPDDNDESIRRIKIQIPTVSIENIEDCDLHCEFLKTLFVFGGKPHQTIVFGFNRILDWKPSEFAEEKLDEKMNLLGDRFCMDYHRTIEHCDCDTLQTCCMKKLREDLNSLFKVIYIEPRYKALEEYNRYRVGDLSIRPFLGNNSSHSGQLSQWCWLVGNRVREAYKLKAQSALADYLGDKS